MDFVTWRMFERGKLIEKIDMFDFIDTGTWNPFPYGKGSNTSHNIFFLSKNSDGGYDCEEIDFELFTIDLDYSRWKNGGNVRKALYVQISPQRLLQFDFTNAKWMRIYEIDQLSRDLEVCVVGGKLRIRKVLELI